MLSDAEYFKSKMGKIDGSGDLGDTLIQVINAKTIISEKDVSGTAQPEGSSSPSPSPSSPPVPEKDQKPQQTNSEKKADGNGEES
jgi:vacuolar protein sorting-associated protein 54